MSNYLKKIAYYISDWQLWQIITMITGLVLTLIGVNQLNLELIFGGFCLVMAGLSIVPMYADDEPEENYKGHFERD